MKLKLFNFIMRRLQSIIVWMVKRIPASAVGPANVRVVTGKEEVAVNDSVNPWLIKAAMQDFMQPENQPASLGLIQAFERNISTWQSEVLETMRLITTNGGGSDIALKVICCNLLTIGMYVQRRLDSANAESPDLEPTAERSANT